MWRVPDDFTGTRVVITGASSGIGRATAHAFAERGADVALAARTKTSLEDAAAECGGAGRKRVIPTDVTDGRAVHELADRAAAELGGIDVWVNNAAVMVYGRFEDTPAGPVPPVTDPERTVRAILRVAARPKAEVTVGQTARLFALGHTLAPGTYDRIVPLAARLGAFRRSDTETGPGNVFEPMPEWNRVTGGWRRHRPVVALSTAAAAIGGLALARRRR